MEYPPNETVPSAEAPHRFMSALASFILSFTGIVIFVGTPHFISGSGEFRVRKILVVAAVCCVAWGIAAVLGLFSFRDTKVGGARNTLIRICALSSFVASILFLAHGSAFFCYGVHKLNIQSQKKFPKSDYNILGVEPAQKEFLLKAIDDFKTDNAKLTNEYAIAARAFANPPVLNLAGVTSKDDLLRREATVSNFINAARNLEDFFEHAPESFEQKMQAAQLSEKVQKKMINEYTNRWNGIWERGRPLWNADVARAENYLKALELLKNNWGEWRWSTASSHLNFKNQKLIGQYNDIIHKINALRQKELDSRQEINDFMSNNSHIFPTTNSMPIQK